MTPEQQPKPSQLDRITHFTQAGYLAAFVLASTLHASSSEGYSEIVNRPVTVATYNVLGSHTDNDPELRESPHYAPWKDRRRYVTQDIKKSGVDIIGLQEIDATKRDGHTQSHQVFADLAKLGYTTAKDYRYHNRRPIYWQKDEYSPIKAGTFPLEDGYNRYGSYAVLNSKLNDQEVAVVNVHLTSQPGAKGDAGRLRGALTVRNLMDKLTEEGDIPGLVLGDLNSPSIPHKHKTSSRSPNPRLVITGHCEAQASCMSAIEKSHLKLNNDNVAVTSAAAIAPKARNIDQPTWNRLDGDNKRHGRQIDMIGITPYDVLDKTGRNVGVHVLNYENILAAMRGKHKIAPSDHNMQVATIELTTHHQ